MPIDSNLYPSGWRQLSDWIRLHRAARRCECMGECGLHRTHPGPRRCVERHLEPAVWARGRVVLTVAHLCHDPGCLDPTHLRAMCQRCHNRYDVPFRRRNRSRTRARQLADGSLSFNFRSE